MNLRVLRRVILISVGAIALSVGTASLSHAEDPPEVTPTPRSGPRVLLDEPVSITFGTIDPTGNSLGQYAFGALTVFADGVECFSVAIGSDRVQDVARDLAVADSPVECRTEGAVISVVDGRGIELWWKYTLTRGEPILFTNWSIGPLDSNAGDVPAPAETGGGPSPRDAVRSDGSDKQSIYLVLAGLLAAVGVGVLFLRGPSRSRDDG